MKVSKADKNVKIAKPELWFSISPIVEYYGTVYELVGVLDNGSYLYFNKGINQELVVY